MYIYIYKTNVILLFIRTQNGKITLLSKCAVCYCKKSIFIKET